MNVSFEQLHTQSFVVGADFLQVTATVDHDDDLGHSIYFHRWSDALDRKVTGCLNMGHGDDARDAVRAIFQHLDDATIHDVVDTLGFEDIINGNCH